MTNSALRNRAILVFTDQWKIETDIDFEEEKKEIIYFYFCNTSVKL